MNASMRIENGKVVSNDLALTGDAIEVARFQRWLGAKSEGRMFRGETAAYLGMSEQEHAQACEREAREAAAKQGGT